MVLNRLFGLNAPEKLRDDFTVADMFQIVSTMALEFPSFLEAIRGISPNIHIDCEPWGHMDHSDGHCSCRSSDRTAVYVYELAFTHRESISPSSTGNASTHSTRTDERARLGPCLGGGGAARIGAFCLSWAWCLWPSSPGVVCAVEDWLIGAF